MYRLLSLAALVVAISLSGCSGPASPPAGELAGPAKVTAEPRIPEGAQTVVLDVQGMHCDACANSIMAKLDTVDGIASSTVSFEKKQADVVYDPKTTTPDAIIATIASVNKIYIATPKDAATAPQATADATTDTAAATH